MEGLFRRCMGATFGLHLHGCGPCTFGVRVSCDWRKIQVLKLVVPKVKNVRQVASDILRRGGVELRYYKLFPQLKFYQVINSLNNELLKY